MNGGELPVLLRKNVVMGLMGISREALYKLVDDGRLHKQYMDYDEFGNGVGHPYYARVEVVALKNEFEGRTV